MRSEAEVMEILAAVRKEHYDTRHACFTYILFDNPPLEKPSDDGEPAEAVELPVLDLSRAASPCNILVTVTCYFGSIELDIGGLVRAYATAAKDTLEQMVIVKLLPAVRLSLIADYGLYGKASYLVENCADIVLSLDFLAKVSLCLLSRTENSARFLAALTELSGDGLTPGSAETLTCVERDGKFTPMQFSAC